MFKIGEKKCRNDIAEMKHLFRFTDGWSFNRALSTGLIVPVCVCVLCLCAQHPVHP